MHSIPSWILLGSTGYGFLATRCTADYDPADRLPAACGVYELGISLGALSKTHGLAGLRIGWIATRDDEVIECMSVFKDYLSISNSAPSEYLATIACATAMR